MRGEKHDIRRLWRRWITMALGGVGMILGVGGASAEPLSLDDFLVRVVERHGEVAASAARLRAARAAAEAVAASQRPTVALRGEGARIFREQEGAASLYFSVQAPVDLWGRFDRICQQALLAYDLRAARHGELVNTLLTSAESLYWRAVLARADVVLYESLVRQREEDFRVAKKRHEVGSVAKLDVIRAEVQLESTRGELTSARTAYADYLVSLKALAGGTPVEPLSGDLAIPTRGLSEDVTFWLDRRPDLVALEVSRALARGEKELAALGMRPEISASLGYTLATDSDRSTPPEHDGALTLVVTVPLSDGGQTRSLTREKSWIEEASSQDLRAARLRAEEELALVRNAWNRSASLVETKRREVELAGEELRIAALRYREGTGTQLDLLDAQVKEQTARRGLLDATKDLYLASARFRGALGLYAAKFVPAESGD